MKKNVKSFRKNPKKWNKRLEILISMIYTSINERGYTMINEFIIATHAEFAEGIVKSLKFLTGYNEIKNVHVINAFTQSEYPNEDIKKLLDKYCRISNVVVMTDILGGSVNQMFMKHMKEYEFKLICGMNLPLLLDIFLKSNNLITNEIIIDSIANARESIKYMNEVFDENASIVENIENDFLN